MGLQVLRKGTDLSLFLSLVPLPIQDTPCLFLDAKRLLM